MKPGITIKAVIMSISMAFFFVNMAVAQTTHAVNVTNFAFTPSVLNINIGDTVKWMNTQGNHNVNGTTATFPSNPESFGNAVGSGWVFMHVFTMAGTYNYQCDPHAGSMTGSITVSTTTGINGHPDADNDAVKAVYPNPATENVIIELQTGTLSMYPRMQLQVFDLGGRKMAVKENNGSDMLKVGTEYWPRGIYVYKLVNDDNIIGSGKIAK